MKIEIDNEQDVCPVKVELDGEELRVVKANRDGTYQVLVFNGKDYRLFMRAKITAFESYDDSEGIWCKMTTKEIWDSWARDLPDVRKARPARQVEWDKFFEEDNIAQINIDADEVMQRIKEEYDIIGRQIPASCQKCSNHPSNGGSGICHCVLGNNIRW